MRVAQQRRLLRGGAVGLLAAAALSLAGLAVLAVTPRPSLVPPGGYSTAVFDRNGALLRLHLASDQRYRLRTSLDDVAPAAIQATLLYEDRHFSRHPGVNPVALVRAAWQTYVRGARPIGASTITMQVARLRFGLTTRTVTGKLAQMARALQIEWHYSKSDILEAYLNLAPYGGNVEGIGAAARVYFDKPAARLTLGEAIALAVVPQNPVARHPERASTNDLDPARERLAQRWIGHYGMTPEQAAQVRLPLSARASSALPFLAPHEVQNAATRGTGLSVPLTLDRSLQAKTRATVQRYLARAGRRGLRNAAVLVVDHRSMDVLASVGSADFFDAGIQGQVDGTRAKRSPGSTLKPLLYAAALDDGLIHPMSLLKDTPVRYAAYAPENFDRGFMGPITATDALNLSRNVPAIDLLQRVGHERFNNLLRAGGVHDLKDADHYGLAMILGGNELTMRELAALYAALANGGTWRPLRERADQEAAGAVPLLSPEASFLVLDMLRQHARPGQIVARPSGIAWKTGTSYGFRDAWTVGIAGPYVVAVWVGHFDGRSDPALVGREAAGPLFFEVIDALAPDTAAREPGPGLNVRRVDVCQPTGDLAGPDCPHVTWSWFIPGVSPIRTSRVHRAVNVHTSTGERACRDAQDVDQAVYEFWPSDMARALARAGVTLRAVPRWDARCDVATRAALDSPPVIKAPVSHLTYHLRGAGQDELPLVASTASDVDRLYWFVDGALVASVARDQPAFWAARTGLHEVAVVDNHGRSTVRRVQVARAR